MSDSTPESDRDPDAEREQLDLPEWDDEYVDRVCGRLVHNYDLEKDRVVAGERFTMYGRMELHSQKHVLHPALSFGHHEAHEHLFVTRTDRVDDATLDRLVDLGHELADEWIDPDEEHFSTDFTFVVIAPTIPDEVAERVESFRDRNMLKYGFHGHYEINLVVVAPETEELAASEEATVEAAFRLWEPIESEKPGVLRSIARRLRR